MSDFYQTCACTIFKHKVGIQNINQIIYFIIISDDATLLKIFNQFNNFSFQRQDDGDEEQQVIKWITSIFLFQSVCS
ncbi:hypothetical protein pb186bvf_011187 [Paramecium bursaria]